MSVKWNIRLIYIYNFMIHTVFILPVIVPFYQNQIGLTYQDFLIGEALFAAMIIAMEIPSGWLSDVWSRKKTLMAGCIFAISGYSLILIADNFTQALLGQAILGISVAFNSGTITSILYDSLAMKGREDLYEKLEGKRHGIGLYAIAIAAVVGGFVYQISPYLPLTLDVISLVIALICATLITEPDRIKRTAEKNPLHDMMITIKYALYEHKEIAGIIMVSTILFCTTKLFLWVQQPYMQFVNIPTDYFGYIVAVGFILAGMIGHFGHHMKHNLSNRHMVMVLTAYTILCGCVAIVTNQAAGIAFILMVSFVWGFGFPFVQAAINKHADPARRATILSTLGFLISMLLIPSNLILGWMDTHYNILAGIGFVMVQLAILSTIGFWLWAKGSKNSSPPM